ncbi:transposase [bacterium]|nr:transposase [bacterium]
MDLVPGFFSLVQPLSRWMYAPTFRNLSVLIVGWIFAVHRTVTGLLRAAMVDRHHASFHRLFASAAWSLDHLGFEEPQGWSPWAVRRTAPMAMLIYGWIVVWFVQDGHRYWKPRPQSWHPDKPHASLRDMLATLRFQTIKRYAFRAGIRGTKNRKLMKTVENIIQLAA